MADNVATAVKGNKGAQGAQAQKPNTATAPVQAPVPAPVAPVATPEPKAPKAPREKLQEHFPSEQEAIAAAQSRTKGPRKAFVVEDHTGKKHFVVHVNEGRALGTVAQAVGFKCEEVGKTTSTRAKAPVGVDGFLAALNALPEAERKALLEQLKATAEGAK